jgi:hypothetical protein
VIFIMRVKPVGGWGPESAPTETNNGATVERNVMNDECGYHKKLTSNKDRHKFVAEDLKHKIVATTNM